MVYGGSAVKTESVTGSAVVCMAAQADKEAQPEAAGEVTDLSAEAGNGITFICKNGSIINTPQRFFVFSKKVCTFTSL